MKEEEEEEEEEKGQTDQILEPLTQVRGLTYVHFACPRQYDSTPNNCTF